MAELDLTTEVYERPKTLGELAPPIIFEGCNYLKIELTYKCNLKCEICPRQTPETAPPIVEDMSIEKVKTIFDCFPDLRVVDFTGLGDVTCYSHWEELMDLCKQRNVKVSFTTNGKLLKGDFVEHLPEYSNICVSLDTTDPEKFFNYRKFPFSELRENLLNLKKKENMTISSVITKDTTIEDLKGLIDFCVEIGASIVFVYARAFTKENYFKYSPFNNPNLTFVLLSGLQYAKNRSVDVRYANLSFFAKPCMEPLNQVTIGLNGDIYTCGYIFVDKFNRGSYKEYILGEEQIVNSENYRLGNIFTKEIHKEKLESVIRNCTSIIENDFYGLLYLMKNGDYSQGSDYCKICAHRWGYTC